MNIKDFEKAVEIDNEIKELKHIKYVIESMNIIPRYGRLPVGYGDEKVSLTTELSKIVCIDIIKYTNEKIAELLNDFEKIGIE